jgi:hypothetical protein
VKDNKNLVLLKKENPLSSHFLKTTFATFPFKSIAFYVPIWPPESNLVTDPHCMTDCLEVTNDTLSNIYMVVGCWQLLRKAFSAA